ncbi:MAG: translocation/assembly module TamB domain-containing protein [Sphingobium sp.]
MVGEPEQAADGDTEVRVMKSRWRWLSRGIVTLVLGALLVVAGGLLWLDTPSGHRFVAQRVASLSPASGLRIEIGGIDGSLYRKARLRDVRFYDPKGLFLSIPDMRLEWWPVSWLSNRLEIDLLAVPRARLHRMPELRSTGEKSKILPDFDIRIMRLSVDRLEVDKAVTGREDVFAISGDADIRNGDAAIDLSARSLLGQDRVVLALDARPDDNRFNFDLTANAPAGGLLATLAGLTKDANLRIKGKGDWARWNGRLNATLDGKSAAGADIQLKKGHFRIDGAVSGDVIGAKGMLARLAAPEIAIQAEGDYADKLISGDLKLQSRAIAADLKGGIHLGGRGFDNLLIDLSLRRPDALLDDFDARGLIARMRLNGPFATARFEYLLRAQQLRFGRTVLRGVRAAGDGRKGGADRPTLIPLELSAARLDGQGDIVSQVLSNVRITGTLQLLGQRLTSTPLKLRSDRLDGELVAQADFGTGQYDIAWAGRVRNLLIPGLGIIDFTSRLKAVPGPKGGFGLTGRIEAVVRRLDNAFLLGLGGGLPILRSDIAMGPDGRLVLRGLSVRAPQISIAGEGVRGPDGSIRISGSGRHESYGPFRLVLTGNISRPAVDLLLAHPLDAAGLADVHVLLDPDAQGYGYTANGQSTLGPFTSAGRIDLPQAADAAILVKTLKVNGSDGQGRLIVVPGGLAGRITFGGSVRGPIDLSVVDGKQKLDAALRIDTAHFDGAMPIDIGRGRLNASMTFGHGPTTIDAKLNGRAMQIGRIRINRFSGTAKLIDGAGKVTATVVGQRGRQFNLQLDADVAANQILFDLGGRLDGQRVSLDRRGRLRQVEGGWTLDPLTLRYRGGALRLDAAEFGTETHLEMRASSLPLSLLDLANVDIGLGGTASGSLSYVQRRGGAPTGTASVTVRGLTRSGITRTSTPIDAGINGELTASRLALRIVAAQKGKVIGKGQALLSPLGAGGLIERLRAAPVRAQLRYAGPADALWRLSTIEIVDLTGQVMLNADVSGTGADPLIAGQMMTRDAVLESPITGMRISGLRSRARFDGSRLVFSEIAGTTGKGGTITGQGSFDFSLGAGIGIDLAFQGQNAELLNRDDIGATVNGPMTIRSDGKGGVISGSFDVVRSHFRLGQAAAIAEIPEMQVIEKNGRQDDFAPAPKGLDWRLAIKANARNRLQVDGLGLTSEWRANLDIGGSVTNPRLVGTADLVRGSYDFAGRRFDLTSGSLRFDGSVPANPTLDITAQASVSGLDATIRITGTSDAPEISFSSSPSLPQEEVLSRILFGSSITQLSAPEALQLAAAVGSLQGGGGGLDPINAVRKAAGLDRLRILPADPATGQGTSIGAGKYLTRKIYVELISDGQGYSATRLEYQVTRWLSLLSSISTLGRQSVTARVSKDY